MPGNSAEIETVLRLSQKNSDLNKVGIPEA